MRIKYNVFSRGFRVTAADPAKTYKKDFFKPFDPEIASEFAAKRSIIQDILADEAMAIPNDIDNDKSPVTILSTGSLTTPELALTALTELEKRGLLRDDRTIELNQWKKSKQYQAIMQEAVAAGCTHFREPYAVIKITVYCREEEEKSVFKTFPKSILDSIDIYRECPLEVVPLYEIAKNCRGYLTSLKREIEKVHSRRFKDWLKDAEDSFLRTMTMLDGMELETKLANQFRANLKSALNKAIPALQSVAEEDYYLYARDKVSELDPHVDVVANAGLDVFETRCTGGKSRVDVNQKRSKKAEIDVGLDL